MLPPEPSAVNVYLGFCASQEFEQVLEPLHRNGLPLDLAPHVTEFVDLSAGEGGETLVETEVLELGSLVKGVGNAIGAAGHINLDDIGPAFEGEHGRSAGVLGNHAAGGSPVSDDLEWASHRATSMKRLVMSHMSAAFPAHVGCAIGHTVPHGSHPRRRLLKHCGCLGERRVNGRGPKAVVAWNSRQFGPLSRRFLNTGAHDERHRASRTRWSRRDCHAQQSRATRCPHL